ncbi:hypothetical protein [Neobacillus niacini]|uniref:hypothetical protein n=1 Tax=Neobacillus niacini TaxID=86668 RepID=UPI0020411A68|nr:hypothetical protein [Neobacillus niacini]MCM3694341.1 hypothetical protein [Neobacillus niacini]
MGQRHTSFGVNEFDNDLESADQRHTSFDGVNEFENDLESTGQRQTSFDGVNALDNDVPNMKMSDLVKNHVCKCNRHKRNKKKRYCCNSKKRSM